MNLSVIIWVKTLIQKWQSRMLDVKNKNRKESQNNEIEVKLKQRREITFFMLQPNFPCRDLNF